MRAVYGNVDPRQECAVCGTLCCDVEAWRWLTVAAQAPPIVACLRCCADWGPYTEERGYGWHEWGAGQDQDDEAADRG
jgi:hypothetical protein